VFCSLSDNIQETFGIVPIEAMAAGLPVVASPVGFQKDLIDQGKGVGLLPNSTREWSEAILSLINKNLHIPFDLMSTSFFLSRDTVVPKQLKGMAMWRQSLFAWLYQNAGRQSDFFKIPANRLVELGAKVEF
jgi:glycosyltransferase involved in cell wall biosynthesis